MAEDGYTVLLVDDKKHMRNTLRQALRGLFRINEVHEAEDGASALQALRGLPDILLPDIVITDLHMEPMCGLTLLKAIRFGLDTCDARLRLIPVVVINPGQTANEDLLRAGAHAVVTMPLVPNQLAQKMRAIVETPPQFVGIASAFGEGKTFFGPLSKFSQPLVAKAKADGRRVVVVQPKVRQQTRTSAAA